MYYSNNQRFGIVLATLLCFYVHVLTGQHYIDSYYFKLTATVNESFGFSMTPIQRPSSISLLVGAPRAGNQLPDEALGGFFECKLNKLDCEENLAKNVVNIPGKLSNVGMSMASTFGSDIPMEQQTLAVCDSRFRFEEGDAPNIKITGTGLCFIAKTGVDFAEDAKPLTFLPQTLSPTVTHVPPMMFGASVANLPNSSAYGFGFPRLMLGFGGTLFSSGIDATLLNKDPFRPTVMWGHSYVGGIESDYYRLQFKRHRYNTAPEDLHQRFEQAVLRNRIEYFGCNGYAVAAGRMFNGDQQQTFDIAEGAPCLSDPELHSASFPPEFMNYYSEQVAPALLNGSAGFGTVRLYHVTKATDAMPCSVEDPAPKFDSGNPDKKNNCFNSSELRITLHGNQFAARFGHSILVMDLDADGFDDVVVAAPLQRRLASSSNRKAKLDNFYGAVFVYINDRRGGMNPSIELSPPSCSEAAAAATPKLQQLCSQSLKSELRFGWSLSNLGDVDGDGKPEFAVGAPLTAKGGAVFVFRGGTQPQLMQSIVQLSAGGFGESISPGADFDASGFPDLAVGAPRDGTGRVYFYPARYLMYFSAEIVVGSGQVISSVGNDLTLQLRFNFSQPIRQNAKLKYKIKLQLIADTSVKGQPRFTLSSNRFYDNNSTILLTDADNSDAIINVKYSDKADDTIADRHTPLVISAVWENAEENAPMAGQIPMKSKEELLKFPIILPMQQQQKENQMFQMATVNWQHNCAGDRCSSEVKLSCQSDINGSSQDVLVVTGQPQEFSFRCLATVANEPAHFAFLLLSFDASLFQLISDHWMPNDLSEESESSNKKLALGNPMLVSANGEEIRIKFKSLRLSPDIDSVMFNFTFTTSSKTPPSSHLHESLQLQVKTELDLSLQASFDRSVHYGDEQPLGFNAFRGRVAKFSSQIPLLTVTLSSAGAVFNKPSYIVMHWPIETLPAKGEQHGKYLMYLHTRPFMTSSASAPSVTCSLQQLRPLRNPLNLRPDTAQEFWSPAGQASEVNVTSSDLLPVAELPKWRVPLRNRQQRRSSSCSRQHRLNFTYSCDNAKCLPFVCQISSLPLQFMPLRLRFYVIAYRFTFTEENSMCSSVRLMPSIQWFSGPDFSDKIIVRQKQQAVVAMPQLIANNIGSLPPEEMQPLMKIIIYAGSALLGIVILSFIVLLLALCTPFFKRRNQQKWRQQQLQQLHQPIQATPARDVASARGPLLGKSANNNQIRYRYNEDEDADFYQ